MRAGLVLALGLGGDDLGVGRRLDGQAHALAVLLDSAHRGAADDNGLTDAKVDVHGAGHGK